VGDDNKRPFKDFPKRVPPLKGIQKKGKSSLTMAVLYRMAFPVFIQKQELIRISINYWKFPLATEKKFYNVRRILNYGNGFLTLKFSAF